MENLIYEKMFQVEQSHWWFSGKRLVINDLLERFLLRRTGRRPLELLDIGCGCGASLAGLPGGFHAVGVDSSPLAIEFCGKRGVEAGLGSLPDDLAFEPASFDAVVLADVLEHVDDDVAAARAAADLVAPGGVMIVTAPALEWMWSRWDEAHGHKRRYRMESFKRALGKTDLAIEFVTYYNTILLPAAALVRLLGKLSGDPTKTQLEVPPAPVNAALKAVFAWERHLVGRIPLPIGLSLLALLRRGGD